MPFTNFLLFLQLENYDNSRYLRLVFFGYNKFFQKSRQVIDFTNKLKAIIVLSILLSFLIGYSFFIVWIIYLVIYILLFIFVYPFILMITNIILYPVDYIMKKSIIKKAKRKLSEFKNLKIIWITWSYWKTSTRQILGEILSSKYKVLTTAWNKNTPLGIAKMIEDELDETHEILILEMWAYKPWDIKEICDMTHPEIWIITWITEQHLERFWNLDNILKTKFELIDSLTNSWIWIVDISNENIANYLKSKQYKNLIKIDSPEIFKYIDDLEWIAFTYKEIEFETKLFAKHSANSIIISYEIAKYFNIPDKDIKESCKKLEYIKHRLELIENKEKNIKIIDDSYNWNIEWIKSITDLLKNSKISWRRIYLTPWIVELWDNSFIVHENIWKILSWCCDLVLLIKNNNTDFIKKWLLESGFENKKIIEYTTALDAHKDLPNILTSWDIIVFQNDLTDNYL